MSDDFDFSAVKWISLGGQYSASTPWQNDEGHSGIHRKKYLDGAAPRLLEKAGHSYSVKHGAQRRAQAPHQTRKRRRRALPAAASLIMLSADDRKLIIDAIALLERVLRETDTSIKSAAVLRALESAEQKAPSAASAGRGGGDYGRESIRWHRRL